MKKRVARKVIKYGMLSNRGRYNTFVRAINRDPEFHFWTKVMIALQLPLKGFIGPRG